jgi:hypothetical protein
MISTIHESRMVNTGRKDRKSNLEVKKLQCVVQYNKFMKGVDRADQYLSYYSIQRKTGKWLKKVVLYLINCALFIAFFIYKTLNTQRKPKYKKFLHEVARSWILDSMNPTDCECSSDELKPAEKELTPRVSKQDPPGRLSGDFSKHKLEKIVNWARKEEVSLKTVRNLCRKQETQ